MIRDFEFVFFELLLFCQWKQATVQFFPLTLPCRVYFFPPILTEKTVPMTTVMYVISHLVFSSTPIQFPLGVIIAPKTLSFSTYFKICFTFKEYFRMSLLRCRAALFVGDVVFSSIHIPFLMNKHRCCQLFHPFQVLSVSSSCIFLT